MTKSTRWLVIVPTLAAAVAVAAAAFSATGGDAAFVRQQENARPARAADLERMMLTTQEPYGRHLRNAVDASCSARGSGELQNPWRCRLAYETDRRATFRVTIASDGAFRAVHLGGTGSIGGCCVELAPADSSSK